MIRIQLDPPSLTLLTGPTHRNHQYVEDIGVALGRLGMSITRTPNGHDTNLNLTDFAIAGSTPGAAN